MDWIAVDGRPADDVLAGATELLELLATVVVAAMLVDVAAR